MESILACIKGLIGGIAEDEDHFDRDIIIQINTAFSILTQIGMGPSSGFVVTGDQEEWTDFIGDRQDLEMVKSYVHLKTKLVFDPPQAGYLIDAIKEQIKELEWRIAERAEGGT